MATTVSYSASMRTQKNQFGQQREKLRRQSGVLREYL